MRRSHRLRLSYQNGAAELSCKELPNPPSIYSAEYHGVVTHLYISNDDFN